jgi:hypothetical protein
MLSLQWELLDPREVRYMLSRSEDFKNDLHMLQGRYQELLHAPLLSDSIRFPERNAVNDLLSFNRAYRQEMVARQPFDVVHGDAMREAVLETDQLYRVYDAVRDARCEYYYVHFRRQALAQLRDMIGVEAFYSGKLPPPVPTWRFRSID